MNSQDYNIFLQKLVNLCVFCKHKRETTPFYHLRSYRDLQILILHLGGEGKIQR